MVDAIVWITQVKSGVTLWGLNASSRPLNANIDSSTVKMGQGFVYGAFFGFSSSANLSTVHGDVKDLSFKKHPELLKNRDRGRRIPRCRCGNMCDIFGSHIAYASFLCVVLFVSVLFVPVYSYPVCLFVVVVLCS
jgi:hypothetical protein